MGVGVLKRAFEKSKKSSSKNFYVLILKKLHLNLQNRDHQKYTWPWEAYLENKMATILKSGAEIVKSLRRP